MKYITTILLLLLSISVFGQLDIPRLTDTLSRWGISFNESDYFIQDTTDKDGKIYINPEWSGVEAGTITEPYSSVVNISSWTYNYAYLWKSGTIDTLTTQINIDAKNVLLGTYGGSEMASIRVDTTNLPTADKADYKDFYDRFKITADSCQVRDLRFYARLDVFAEHTTVYNNEFNGDSLVGDALVIFRDSCYAIHNYIHDAVFEGIFYPLGSATFGVFQEAAYNYILDINKAYFEGATQEDADGDGIQVSSLDYGYIHHNVIDRSNTGNKFCIVYNDESSNHDTMRAWIHDNVLIAAIPTSEGGAAIYLGSDHQSKIYNNTILQLAETDNYMTAVFGGGGTNDYNTVYGNLIKGFNKDLATSRGDHWSWYHNTTIDCNSGNTPNITTDSVLNNISEFTLSDASNISLITYSYDTVFNDYDNGDYSLAEFSPAIGIGIDLGYGLDAGYLQYTAPEADIEERKTKIFAPNGVPFAPNGILFLTE